MFRVLLAFGLVAALCLPAVAAPSPQKKAICEFGANDQKLTGAKRKAFLTKCLKDEDEPAPAADPKPKAN